jgi:hypothetical protein
MRNAVPPCKSQVEAELDLAERIALDMVQDEFVRIDLALGAGKVNEIFRQIVRAGGHLDGEIAVGSLFFQCPRLLNDPLKGRVLIAGAVGEVLNQVERGRWIDLIQRPEDDGDDEEKTSEIVLLHGMRD